MIVLVHSFLLSYSIIRWFEPVICINSTSLFNNLSAVYNWRLSPKGTLVSADPCNNKIGVVILSALNIASF